ncbi:MAG: DUF5615 family PIN-like protein [Acidobacteria bacterium]|nr:DUF5615 family PIN-like protein [Acidobacteriota bacterium]
MTVRFQADASLDERIVRAVCRRAPNVDFQTARAAGLPGRHDLDVLAMASAQGRVLITHDVQTMPYWFAQFITTATSPGVLMIPQTLPLAVAVEELVMIWAASESHEWVNRIARLPL